VQFREIIKIVTTKCHILQLKSTKFDFGWGSALDPLPQTPLLDLRGLLLRGKRGGERKGLMGEEEKGYGGSGGEGVDIAWPDL